MKNTSLTTHHFFVILPISLSSTVINIQIIIRLTLPSLRRRGGPTTHMALVRDLGGSAGGGGGQK